MSEKWQVGLGIAGMCTVMAVTEALSPPVSRPSGKLSFIFGAAYDSIGEYGPALLWGICGVVFLLAALGLRSNHRTGRNK